MSAEDFAKVRALGARARSALNEGVDNKYAIPAPGGPEERLANLLDEIAEFGSEAEPAHLSWDTCWRCGSLKAPLTAIAIDFPGEEGKYFKGTCPECSCIRLGGRSKPEPEPEPEPAPIVWRDCKSCKSMRTPHSISQVYPDRPDKTGAKMVGICPECSGGPRTGIRS